MKMSAHVRLAVPLLIGMALSIALLVFSEMSHLRLNAVNEALSRAMETQAVAAEVRALMAEAETAQRGFLLTGQRKDLEPYFAAVPQVGAKLDALAHLVEGDAGQMVRVQRLRTLIPAKLGELDTMLARYRDAGPQAARARLQADDARVAADQIRSELDAVANSERAAQVQRSSQWDRDIAGSRFGLAIATALDVILLIIVYTLAARELVRRERMRVQLVEQKRMLEEQVRDRTAELSELSSDLQRVQEVERSQLARELHDEMGSILVSAKMDVSWAISRTRESHPEATEKLRRALRTLDDGVEVKRRIMDDLRPALLDNLGLGAAITWHVEQMSERSGLHCAVLVSADDRPLPSDIAIALFRVVQEALTSIVRHAQAANTRVELQRGADEVRLEISDDGDGLPRIVPAGQSAHGIMSMRQRIVGVGGEFDIRTNGVRGTIIRVRVPLIGPAG